MNELFYHVLLKTFETLSLSISVRAATFLLAFRPRTTSVVLHKVSQSIALRDLTIVLTSARAEVLPHLRLSYSRDERHESHKILR